MTPNLLCQQSLFSRNAKHQKKISDSSPLPWHLTCSADNLYSQKTQNIKLKNAIVPPYNDTKLAMPTISTFMHPFSKPSQLSITTCWALFNYLKHFWDILGRFGDFRKNRKFSKKWQKFSPDVGPSAAPDERFLWDIPDIAVPIRSHML